MSSAKSLVKNYEMLEQTPKQIDESYPTVLPFFLGIVHIICGIVSIALGIGAICIHATGYFIGYGIWCGFFFILAGCCVMITCCRRCAQSWMIMVSLVFGVLAACIATVQFSLGVAAAANDNGGLPGGRLTASLTTTVAHYDIYHSKQHDRTSLCSGSDKDYRFSSWGAVDVLLLLVAFIEAAVSVATAVLGCRSICCGQVAQTNLQAVDVVGIPRATDTQGGAYYNKGYSTSGGPSSSAPPPLYYAR